MPKEQFVKNITNMLDDIQNQLFQRALNFRNDNTFDIDTPKDFYDMFTSKENQRRSAR
jgi:prolyl-tRNA synthetase